MEFLSRLVMRIPQNHDNDTMGLSFELAIAAACIIAVYSECSDREFSVDRYQWP